MVHGGVFRSASVCHATRMKEGRKSGLDSNLNSAQGIPEGQWDHFINQHPFSSYGKLKCSELFQGPYSLEMGMKPPIRSQQGEVIHALTLYSQD